MTRLCPVTTAWIGAKKPVRQWLETALREADGNNSRGSWRSDAYNAPRIATESAQYGMNLLDRHVYRHMTRRCSCVGKPVPVEMIQGLAAWQVDLQQQGATRQVDGNGRDTRLKVIRADNDLPQSTVQEGEDLPLQGRAPADQASSDVATWFEGEVSYDASGRPAGIAGVVLPADMPEDDALRFTLKILGLNTLPGHRWVISAARHHTVAWERTKQFVKHPDTGKYVKAQATRCPATSYHFVQRPIPREELLTGDLVSVKELRDRIRKAKTAAPRVNRRDTGPLGINRVINASDPQNGKGERGGTALTVARALDCIRQAAEQVEADRAARVLSARDPGVLFFGGDNSEGIKSNYAAQAFLADLNLTDQIDLSIDLGWKFVETLAPLFPEGFDVIGVPCNHGELNRDDRSGKAMTDQHDNTSILILRQLERIARANPAAYGHVRFITPRRGDLAVTVDVGFTQPTRVTFMHGHQARSGSVAGLRKWWQGHQDNLTEHGESTVLIAGHNHHWMSESNARTIVGLPALDGGSGWLYNVNGAQAAPGIVTVDLQAGRMIGQRMIVPSVDVDNAPAVAAAAAVTAAAIA